MRFTSRKGKTRTAPPHVSSREASLETSTVAPLPSKGIASTPPPKGEARSSSTAEKAREARTSGAAADKAALIEKLEKLQEEAASIRQRLDRHFAHLLRGWRASRQSAVESHVLQAAPRT